MNSHFLAFDFETANHSRHSACQLGICLVQDGRVVDQQSWLIRPTSKTFVFSDLHGITYDMVRNQLTFAELWPLVRPYMEGRIIAAHNAAFDMGVLTGTLSYYGLAVPSFQVIDTLDVARRAWPHLSNHKLSTVARFLAVDLQHHDAASDARACAEILLRSTGQFIRVRQVAPLSLSGGRKAE